MSKNINLDLNDDNKIELIANALSSKIRRTIIKLSTEGSYSVMQIAEFLNMPVSTTSFHLKILKDAGFIQISPNPTKKGNEKVISQYISVVNLDFRLFHAQKSHFISIDIPLGSYSDFNVSSPCSLADSTGLMIGWDRPEAFYSTKRFNAQLLSFSKGYIEYKIPVFEIADKLVSDLIISLELCSECPMFNNNWKSDITFWINDTEICTYESLGDYGDRQGKNNPSFWPSNASQYGMLKKIHVTKTATFLDEEHVSDANIDSCHINDDIIIKLKIGIKENAKHIGGVNIFGKNFGDSDQNIYMQITYNDK